MWQKINMDSRNLVNSKQDILKAVHAHKTIIKRLKIKGKDKYANNTQTKCIS